MRRSLLLVALSGCFCDAAIGGAASRRAPASPSGDGAYERVGAGIGWANAWGMLQASGVVKLGPERYRLDTIDLSVSSFKTTFADRPEMTTYGVHLGLSLDPELTVIALGVALGAVVGGG